MENLSIDLDDIRYIATTSWFVGPRANFVLFFSFLSFVVVVVVVVLILVLVLVADMIL